MIIRTDLYRDILIGRRRDRSAGNLVKMIAALVIGGAATIWILAYLEVTSLRTTLASEKQAAKAVADKLSAAKDRALALDIKVSEREAVLAFAKKRVNWAPLLEEIFASVSENIELSSLQASCLGQEDCEVVINGRTAAESPRLECDKFRLLLLELFKRNGIDVVARFEKLESSSSKIQLADAAYPAADFSIAIRWKNTPHAK